MTTTAPRKQAFVRELLGRSDYAIIGEIVEPGSKVLDLGCGDGELLQWLAENKGVDARGVEISGERVHRAIARGVSVYQGDIDQGLADYPDQAFDYVILGQTLQETRGPGGDCGVPELWALARAAFHADQRALSAHQALPVSVVRFAEHSLPDGARFRRPGGDGRAASGAALFSLGPQEGAFAAQLAGGGGGLPGAARVTPF